MVGIFTTSIDMTGFTKMHQILIPRLLKDSNINKVDKRLEEKKTGVTFNFISSLEKKSA